MGRIIWLSRHGRREDDDPQWRRSAERPDDPDLSAKGIIQAQALARRLADWPIAALFSSPYLRTMHTAHYCSLATELPINIEDGIGEWLDPAKFSASPRLLPRAELARRFQVNEEHLPLVHPDFPEGREKLYRRGRLAISRILAATEGNLLLVGHQASCKAVIFALLNRRLRLRYPPCSVAEMVEEGGSWQLRNQYFP